MFDRIIIFLFILSGVTLASGSFSEELFIKPLSASRLYTYFQFVTLSDASKPFEHSQLLPHSIRDIISSFNLEELHLTLTEGQWRHDQWGYPVLDAAPGAELYAWFAPNVHNVDQKWKQLSETLSGLFCASLNFIDASNTVQPQMALKPTSAVPSKRNSTWSLRYASLPREIVCTENLTPWKKLLPCESTHGLSTLLNSRMIHNTNYHSLGVHYRKVCTDLHCTAIDYEFKQTVSLVYDLKIVGSTNWSFRRLFGQGLAGPCPLSDSTKIYVDITVNETTPFLLSPQPDEHLTSVRGGSEVKLVTFVLKPDQRFMMNVAASYLKSSTVNVPVPPPLHFARHIVGYGQEQGGIVTEITNNHWSSLHVVLLENAPWWLPVQLSSLRINGQAVSDLVLSRYFSPGRSRAKPYHLELLLKLPPRSTTTVAINFEFVFLKWQEYPPDANHGFYVGSALVSALLPTARNFTSIPLYGTTFSSLVNASQPYYHIVLRSGGAAVSLPTPDFSMPYNVICLACTVVALAFGPLHNICTKQLSLKILDASASKLQRMLAFITRRKIV